MPSSWSNQLTLPAALLYGKTQFCLDGQLIISNDLYAMCECTALEALTR